uniref:Multidrug efflux pump n=1 Tax=Enterobacter cloacae TaxID=550 RepID=Q0GKY0_ENTCL|nr:multidrug efflux pump [Enterobacter cloacae]
MLALIIVTLALLVFGLSTGLKQSVGMSRLQPMGIALMAYVVRLALLRTTPKHQLITATAYATWPALVAPIIAPPGIGFIGSCADWRWIPIMVMVVNGTVLRPILSPILPKINAPTIRAM